MYEAQKRYRIKNKDKYARWQRRRYSKHKKQINVDTKNRRLINNDKYAKTWKKKNWEATVLINVRLRAKREQLDYDLTSSDIIIPSRCPILGIPIIKGGRPLCASNPSIDRKDPSKGYTKDNIWIISWRANRLKSDGTLQEFQYLVKHWPV